MKIIHTSDWHLGQKFLFNDREEEHQLALDWLLECISKEEADGLIVAGDIFDIGNPPNYARRMYYQFLTRLIKTSCRHILIVGGNHDSPAMLNAPKDLLEALNIHVVGAATGELSDEIVEWKKEDGSIEAVIAAVPFLRDRDLKYSQAGESGLGRLGRVREGIRQHYQEIGALVEEQYGNTDAIKLATGHLYAVGADASAKQDNIYIGDTENIAADQFPTIFDYVALGHIHRPQFIGNQEHIRYSGSIIPLSFSETKDDKSVYLLEFGESRLQECKTIPIPVFRRLKTIEGPIEEVEEKLLTFGSKEREGLTPWVEILVQTDRMIPQLDKRLREKAEGLPLEILKIRIIHEYASLSKMSNSPELDELDEADVFRMKCESYGASPDEMEELAHTFQELRDWVTERETEL